MAGGTQLLLNNKVDLSIIQNIVENNFNDILPGTDISTPPETPKQSMTPLVIQKEIFDVTDEDLLNFLAIEFDKNHMIGEGSFGSGKFDGQTNLSEQLSF